MKTIKPSWEIYNELKRRVLPHVAHYQTDLTKHDYKQIVEDNYNGPFVFGYRDCGTNLLKLKLTMEAMVKETWLQKLVKDHSMEEIREVVRKELKESLIWLTYSNTSFLYFDGQDFHTCTKERASQIYLNHIDRICNCWHMNANVLN